MVVVQEVVVAASTAPSSSLSVWGKLLDYLPIRDLKTGASLPSLKNNSSGRNALCSVGNGCISAAQTARGIVRFWTWDQASPAQESFLPEAILAIAATTDGAYFIAGGQSGTLYVWEVGTARMLSSWPAHYMAITSLAVVDGGSVFVSGGEDAAVKAWPTAKVIGGGNGKGDSENPVPIHSWFDHTLPITGLHCGFGGVNGVTISSSLDGSCKIRQVSSGILLRSILLPVSLLCCTTDQGDHCLYAGGKNGIIFDVSLVGSRGDAEKEWRSFSGHSRAVTCLKVSSSGCQLASGSEDGTIRLWDLQTGQCVRVWGAPNHHPIAALLILQDPPIPQLTRRGHRNSRQAQKTVLGLNKYQSGPARGDLNSWDGCPVVKSKFVKYEGIAVDCGLLRESHRRDDEGCNGPAEIEKEVRETREISQRLWTVNQKLLEFCENRVMAGLGERDV